MVALEQKTPQLVIKEVSQDNSSVKEFNGQLNQLNIRLQTELSTALNKMALLERNAADERQRVDALRASVRQFGEDTFRLNDGLRLVSEVNQLTRQVGQLQVDADMWLDHEKNGEGYVSRSEVETLVSQLSAPVPQSNLASITSAALATVPTSLAADCLGCSSPSTAPALGYLALQRPTTVEQPQQLQEPRHRRSGTATATTTRALAGAAAGGAAEAAGSTPSCTSSGTARTAAGEAARTAEAAAAAMAMEPITTTATATPTQPRRGVTGVVRPP